MPSILAGFHLSSQFYGLLQLSSIRGNPISLFPPICHTEVETDVRNRLKEVGNLATKTRIDDP